MSQFEIISSLVWGILGVICLCALCYTLGRRNAGLRRSFTGAPLTPTIKVTTQSAGSSQEFRPQSPRATVLLSYKVGIRAWKTYSEQLHSVNSSVLWTPGTPLHAKCTETHPEPPPVSSCSCGIYAAKPGHPEVFSYINGPHVVVGVVALWGRIIEGEFGYRAEYAYPLALIKSGSLARSMLLEIASLYNIRLFNHMLSEKEIRNANWQDSARD